MKRKWSIISIANNLFWLIIMVGISLFAIIFNTQVAWFLTYFFLFVLICSVFSMRVRLSRYRVVVDPLIVVTQGSHAQFMIKLVASGQRSVRVRGPLRLTGVLELLDNQFELVQQERENDFSFNFSVQFDGELERGIYRSLQIEFVTKDLFNLLRKTNRFSVDTTLMVMPPLALADSQEIITLLEMLRVLPLSTNFVKSQDIKALRDYREGDQLNKIDWKLSAKRDHLMVKDLENEHQEKVSVLFYGNEGKFYEDLLATFYSLALKSSQLKISEWLMYDETKQEIEHASPERFASGQPVYNEEELIQAVQRVELTKKKLVILGVSCSKALLKVSGELGKRNQVILFFYDRQGKLAYQQF